MLLADVIDLVDDVVGFDALHVLLVLGHGDEGLEGERRSSVPHERDPEVPVRQDPESKIERADLAQLERPDHDAGWTADDVVAKERSTEVRLARRRAKRVKRMQRLIKHVRTPPHDDRARSRGMHELLRKERRGPEVVIVEEGHPAAGGRVDRGIACSGHTPRDVMGDDTETGIGDAGQPLAGIVRRGVVDDDDFEGCIVLRKRRCERSAQQAPRCGWG